MLMFALVRAIEVVGEAASKVSDETRLSVQLPWSAVVGMRNRPIHAYFDIDRDILWATAVQSLPQLGSVLRAALGTRANGA